MFRHFNVFITEFNKFAMAQLEVKERHILLQKTSWSGPGLKLTLTLILLLQPETTAIFGSTTL
jgi:hypothetical protein